jgi:general secretion pathway protein A
MTMILIVDEAHLLSPEILEEIRLLSNLESNEDKLLQIILVGQPELDEKLDSMEFRQLKQRVAVRAQLTGLTLIETRQYILQRLKQAGYANGDTRLFPPETISAIHRSTQGLPRLINLVCENALIEAYGIRAESVTPEIIQTVTRQFRLDVETTNRDRDLYPTHLEHNLRHLVRALLEDFRHSRRAANDERPLSFQGPEK